MLSLKLTPHTNYKEVKKDLIDDIYEDIIKSNSLVVCDEIKKETAIDAVNHPEKFTDPNHPRKYLDYSVHLPKAIRRACSLDLATQPPRDILDIGTGAGYFPLVCRHLLHNCEATEIYKGGFLGPLIESFKISPHILYLKSKTLLPSFGRRFDIITAFEISFSRHNRIREGVDRLWGAEDWRFLMDDLRLNHLTAGGTVWFALNAQFPGRLCYDAELLAFFHEYGAEVLGPHVVFRK